MRYALMCQSEENNITEVHQVRTNTCYDRYPVLFQQLQECCSDDLNSHPILSYGCSTGEECFTLREKYFEKSPIVGVDINKENLQIAKNKNASNSRIQFLFSNQSNLLAKAPYSAILCMSVLCRWPESENIEDISELYSFTKFEEKLNELHALLAVGGALVIYNASFRFVDTFLYEKYKVFRNDGVNIESDFVHKFDTKNKKLITQHYPEWIFIKEKE